MEIASAHPIVKKIKAVAAKASDSLSLNEQSDLIVGGFMAAAGVVSGQPEFMWAAGASYMIASALNRSGIMQRPIDPSKRPETRKDHVKALINQPCVGPRDLLWTSLLKTTVSSWVIALMFKNSVPVLAHAVGLPESVGVQMTDIAMGVSMGAVAGTYLSSNRFLKLLGFSKAERNAV